MEAERVDGRDCPSVSEETLCNRSPTDESQDEQSEARLCWLAFAVDSI